MRITTNNQPRPLLYGWQLPESARAEFDYYNDDEAFNDAMFFSYKGVFWDLGQFVRGSGPAGWDGCQALTAFSGVLVRLVKMDDGPGVIVAYCHG